MYILVMVMCLMGAHTSSKFQSEKRSERHQAESHYHESTKSSSHSTCSTSDIRESPRHHDITTTVKSYDRQSSGAIYASPGASIVMSMFAVVTMAVLLAVILNCAFNRKAKIVYVSSVPRGVQVHPQVATTF